MKRKVFFVVLFVGIMFSAFGQNVSDFDYVVNDGKVTITFYYGNTNDVTIPASIYGWSVVAIGSNAFRASGKITSVIIPNTVTSIGESAFHGNQLTSVTIPNSVTSIGKMAFYSNKLTSVTIGNTVTSIGDQAFSFNQLTSVTIPNSVTSIGDQAFSSNQLTSVTIPNSVINFNSRVFGRAVEIRRP